MSQRCLVSLHLDLGHSAAKIPGITPLTISEFNMTQESTPRSERALTRSYAETPTVNRRRFAASLMALWPVTVSLFEVAVKPWWLFVGCFDLSGT